MTRGQEAQAQMLARRKKAQKAEPSTAGSSDKARTGD